MTPTKSRRVTLTKAHLSSEAGSKLRELLGNIAEDGVISDAELSELANWLKSAPADIPAVAHLSDTLIDIMRDGVVSDAERDLLLKQIARVLPADDRERVSFARDSAREAERVLRSAKRFAREELPTEAQLRYIQGLGGSLPLGATRDDASDEIERLLGSNKSITPRQWMVLRFWNKVPPPVQWGRKHVSAWMDEWYSEDSDRQLAWEIFKEESGDYGVSQDPERVPLGAGDRYLARVKNLGETRTEAPARTEESSSGVGIIVVVIVVVVAIIVKLNS